MDIDHIDACRIVCGVFIIVLAIRYSSNAPRGLPGDYQLRKLKIANMIHTEEGWFNLKDGTNLYTKTWKVSMMQQFSKKDCRSRPISATCSMVDDRLKIDVTKRDTNEVQPDTPPTAILIHLHGFR